MTPASSAATKHPAVASTKPPRLLLAGLLLATVMATLDTQVVATALPTIATELRGLPLYAWVSTAYLLSLAVVTPLAGKVGDLLGRRPVLLAALAVFMAGSALCGLAQSMPQLVAFRAVQGVGGGGLTVSVFAIVGELFEPRQRARYQGSFAAVFAVSGLAGPLIGGALTQQLGWRSRSSTSTCRWARSPSPPPSGTCGWHALGAAPASMSPAPCCSEPPSRRWSLPRVS